MAICPPPCGRRFEPYSRAEGYQKYCSEECRIRAWRASEERARDQGRDLAAANSAEYVEVFRDIAYRLAQGGKAISIDDVREEAIRQSFDAPSGNWMGSVFAGKDWRRVSFTKARHQGSHARMISMWVLQT